MSLKDEAQAKSLEDKIGEMSDDQLVNCLFHTAANYGSARATFCISQSEEAYRDTKILIGAILKRMEEKDIEDETDQW